MARFNKSQIIIALLIFSIIAVMSLQVFWLSRAYRLNIQNQKASITKIIKESIEQTRVNLFFNNEIKSWESTNRQFELLNSVSKFIISSKMDSASGESSGREKVCDNCFVEKRGDENLTHDSANSPDITYKLNIGSKVTSSDDHHIIDKIHETTDSSHVIKMLDSVINKRFVAEGIQNTFKILLIQPVDTAHQNLVTKDEFIVVKDIVKNNLLSYVVIKSNLKTLIASIGWLFATSIIILCLLLYTAIALIRSFKKEKQLAEMKNDFLSNITHEFKTPIATVSLAIEMIRDFGVRDDPQKMDEFIDICQSELKRVSTMMETVLRLAQQKPYILQKEEADFENIMNNFKTQAKPLLLEKNVSLDIQMVENLPKIHVDPVHIENILYNLLDNSVKYSREKLHVSIVVKYTSKVFKISFSDNGIGIPKPYIDNIFDNFFRVPTGNVHSTKGFGLGLSYVKKIVDLHEGVILVESKVDEGTTFHIILPLN